MQLWLFISGQNWNLKSSAGKRPCYGTTNYLLSDELMIFEIFWCFPVDPTEVGVPSTAEGYFRPMGGDRFPGLPRLCVRWCSLSCNRRG